MFTGIYHHQSYCYWKRMFRMCEINIFFSVNMYVRTSHPHHGTHLSLTRLWMKFPRWWYGCYLADWFNLLAFISSGYTWELWPSGVPALHLNFTKLWSVFFFVVVVVFPLVIVLWVFKDLIGVFINMFYQLGALNLLLHSCIRMTQSWIFCLRARCF